MLAELPIINSIPVRLLGHEASVGRLGEAAALAEVGAYGPDADGHRVALGDD
jgi:hypothetical protein